LHVSFLFSYDTCCTETTIHVVLSLFSSATTSSPVIVQAHVVYLTEKKLGVYEKWKVYISTSKSNTKWFIKQGPQFQY